MWQIRRLFSTLSAVPTRQQAGAVHRGVVRVSGRGWGEGFLTLSRPAAPGVRTGCCSARGPGLVPGAGAGWRGGRGAVGGAEPGPGLGEVRVRGRKGRTAADGGGGAAGAVGPGGAGGRAAGSAAGG